MYDVTLCPGLLDPGDGGSTLLHIVGNCLSVHTVIYKSSASPLQETENLRSEYLSPFLSTYVNYLKSLK
jgi:hypothetical protein